MDLDKLLMVIKDHFHLEGELSALPGDIDKNYLLTTSQGTPFIIKLTQLTGASTFIAYQKDLLKHLEGDQDLLSPVYQDTIFGNEPIIIDDYQLWVLSWIDGKLWSDKINKAKSHYLSLGSQAAQITKRLSDFDHPFAHRYLEWDLSNVDWIEQYFDWFEDRSDFIRDCYKIVKDIMRGNEGLRKQVIHNDVNENNIIIEGNSVKAIIDYGDAIYSEVINDVAIACTYGSMGTLDPLRSASLILQGYNKNFPILEKELQVLYGLVIARLLISITKSTINKKEHPENQYHQVSAQPAWDLLCKWRTIDPDLAHFTFRSACGFTAYPKIDDVRNYLHTNRIKPAQLFLDLDTIKPVHIPMDVESLFLGLEEEYNDPLQFERKIEQVLEEKEGNMAYGAYMECRPFYITDAFRKEGLFGPEYRTIHLGEDYWVPSGTTICAPLDGKVYVLQNNNIYKDYGPTLILSHSTSNGTPFYTLYGHLSATSLDLWKEGDEVKKGDILAWIGNPDENGSWAPHLHFQIICHMLGNKDNFPGVGFPEDINFWKDLTPDPHLLIDLPDYPSYIKQNIPSIMEKRKQYLGPNLSLSYQQPLHIVRGNLQYLIDADGQKYLDMVNNVAHVGHENPRVVKAGQKQMAVLNTNSRYLHHSIIAYAEALLQKLPEELEVIYFTNSGSEANELALRMAETFTGGHHHIAIEGGYHGNTSKCIAVSSYKFDGPGGMGKPANTLLMDIPDQFRGKYKRGENDVGLKYGSQIDDLINGLDFDSQKLASYISESIMSCGGQIVLPDGYLPYIYGKVRKAGGICIADEVQTGFGRVGVHYWAFQLHGVIPDIVTMGKPIGNGHPIGAVACTREVAEKFNNGMEFFNTYGGNPVSCIIGLEVIKIIEEEKLQQHAAIQGDTMIKGLTLLQNEFECIGDVRGKGLFLGIEIMKGDQPDAVTATKIVNSMRTEKILLSTDGPDHNVIKIKPPMIIENKDVNEFLMKFRKVLNVL